MEELILRTSGLCFNEMIHYPDIKIYKNKVTFIVGESGSGKSTLLKLFNGTLTQSKGEIFYCGNNQMEINTIELRKEVCLISQSVFLFDKTIKENFEQFYEYRTLELPPDNILKEYLDICCVHFDLDKDCTTMSGGERQRVYMAIYLSFMPKVLMLDEPTSALDNQNSYDVINNIMSFCKEKSISLIVVSHDNDLTEKFAEERIILKKGD